MRRKAGGEEEMALNPIAQDEVRPATGGCFSVEMVGGLITGGLCQTSRKKAVSGRPVLIIASNI